MPLQAAVSISEFLASNDAGLRDEDGDASDWLEIFNSGPTSVALGGWTLTDNAASPKKWELPAVTIPPNGFLLVWASGKDRRDPTAPLHTNFSLGRAGGYLGLFDGNGARVFAYASYPEQYPDRPYGVQQTVSTTQLVGPSHTVKVFIPTGSSPSNDQWTARTYNDAVTGWTSGTSGVGYEATVPGFAFKTWFANVSVGNIATANGVIANPSQQTAIYGETRAVVNYMNTGSDGHYSPQSNPEWLNSGDRDNYVVEATGVITIPTAGTWTFGVNSDDGFELHIDGTRVCFFDGGRGASDTLGRITLSAGLHSIRVMIYEGNGGSSGELFAKQGSFTSWDSGFRLVGDTANGGLAVASIPIGNAGSGYLAEVNKNVESTMRNVSSSAYLRYPFTIANPASLTTLSLPIKYDDGFIAYLNGTEVARRNAPAGPPSFNSVATIDRSPVAALLYETIDLTDFRSLLVPSSTGTNILAIHGLNRSAGDNDFLIRPELAQFTVTTGVEGYFTTPTPGGFNVAPAYNKVGPVSASVQRGFFTSPITVALSTPTAGATIRYTFDGSTPSLASSTSATYSGPLSISKTTTLRYAAFKTGSDPSDSGTQTYLFLSDVIIQSPTGQPPVVTNPTGATQTTTTWPASRVNNQVLDYGMDPNVVNAAPYSSTIVEDLKSLPTFSIVTDLPHLFDPGTGIYANPGGDGIQWERPASLELIHPDGTVGFQMNCGLRMRGGFSRSTDNPKHSFRLFFRDDYGAGKLRYPLFGKGVGAEEFDKFDLRTMQNYSWAFQGDSRGVFVRDVVARDMQLAMNQPSSHGGWYHLYINGQYWGIYNIDERPEANFAATYFGGKSDDYDTIKVAPDSGYSVYATDGSIDAWYALWDLADLDPNKAGDVGLSSTQSEATNNAIYQRMQGNNPDGTRNPAYPVLLDPVNLIDEMLVALWGGNLDAPTSNFLGNERPNNWFGVRNRTEASSGFKFVLHDSEHTLLNVNEDRTGPWPAGNSAIQGASAAFSYSSPQTIWQQLLYSQEFRMLAADRIQKHCFNDGVLTPARATAIYDARIAEISRAVVGESARWGDAQREPPLLRDTNWLPAVNSLRSSFFPNRTSVFLNQLRAKGIFPAIHAPQFNQRGGSVPFGFQVTLTNPNAGGVIYYTLDGSDPRALGGGINSGSAVAYSAPITLPAFRSIRARVLSGGVWSALAEASFYVQQDFTKLAITEIMYNPLPSGAVVGDEFEFLELKNTGNNPIDLSGLSFTKGITYSFPVGGTLAPGAFWVLARNPVEFAKRYPGVTVNGIFSGRLDNAGEELAISHTLGGTVLSLTYDDDVPWPVAADGYGFSVVNRDPLADPAPNNGAKWRASAQLHGSPGRDDPEPTLPAIFVNEVLSNPISPAQDAIELYNSTSTAVDISHWWLTDDRNVLKYRIPAGTVIPAGGYLTFTEAQFNTGSATSFALSAQGESVYVLSGNATGQLTGWSHGFEFGASAKGVSFGRYVNSAGEELFPAQKTLTFGAQNSGPLVGPLVISEIQYHPAEGYEEYVEIRNITNAAVPLFDPANPANTWKLSGMGFVFPQGVSIPSQGMALVVAGDPVAFRSKYAVPAAVQIFGPATGVLQDSGERLSLTRPDAPVISGGATVIPYIVVDSVRYNDKSPWPPSADGSGPSLQKITAEAFGDDPANWFASGITPGLANALNQPPSVTLTAPSDNATFTLPTNIVLQATAVDPDGGIIKVEFYDGGKKLGEASTHPYSFTWAGAAPGAHVLTARAVDTGLAVGISNPVSIQVNVGAGGNNGIGLRGDYYNSTNLTGTPVTRIDATVNLDFGSTFPPAGINQTNLSCRWTGQVLPRTSGTYTFYTNSDDGVRLWVDGQELISNWTDHGATENVGFIDLVAGQLYDIRMEWYQGGGGAIAQLSWSATGLGKQIIPASQLYPAGAPRIISQPQAVTVEQGSHAAFTVVASGSGNTFQWRRNGAPIPGATGPSLALPEVQQSQAGSYSVIITNTGGSVTSNNANLVVTFTDTDGDGMQDAWEIAHGLNPNSNADAGLDSDGDGATNLEEFLAGTDPRDGTSVMRLFVSPAYSGGHDLSFLARSQKSYSIRYKNDLRDSAWIKLQDVPPAVGTRSITLEDPFIGAQRFYQLVTPTVP